MKSAEIRKVIKVWELMKTWDESDHIIRSAAYYARENEKNEKRMDKHRRAHEKEWGQGDWDVEDIIRLVRLMKN